MKPDYRTMKVGERKPMPALNEWTGDNQSLYYEIQAYCLSTEPHPQFEVETKRISREKVEFWLFRTR